MTFRSISSREATGRSTGFLPHIEGLRGIAVLAVLWFHMGLPVAVGVENIIQEAAANI